MSIDAIRDSLHGLLLLLIVLAAVAIGVVQHWYDFFIIAAAWCLGCAAGRGVV